eukprot:TRINITY_DN60152_c0_g1_i1.p2 TRINITY_DN60152_c0_g1~~TRINITY_DN60152_c0_g1_i1.p2  ORF type:complete len:190 (+),score=22.43 TRINITY_DN60152_c0_g1_i1:3-572(+)
MGLYEDEGTNYDYEKGAYTEIPLIWDEENQSLTIGTRQGSFEGMQATREFKITFVQKGKSQMPACMVSYSGKQIQFALKQENKTTPPINRYPFIMNKMKKKLVLLLVPLLFACGAYAKPAPVMTEYGLVQGSAEKDITVYKGIPFAAPPVGDLRWKAPQPAEKWDGVRKATKFANDPYQGDGNGPCTLR